MSDAAGKPGTGRFYVWMAAICVLIAFGGFAPTYWLQLIPGTFIGPALLHVHAILFSAWALLLLVQARHAQQGRMAAHRAFGLAGISLATALVFTGLAATILSLNVQVNAGYGDRARALAILPVTAITLFAGFFVAAIGNIRRPEWHKRLMLLATLSLLQAAMARVFFVLIAGGGPGRRPGLGPPPPLVFSIAPSLLLELLIVAGIAYDWRTRGRPHPAWLVGAAVTTTVVLLRVAIGGTAAWRAIANALAHLAG
ncbi:MAG: hypothetical protein KGL25_12710 [Gammaproteobacteria bacterium]|nr:hypothetical protein [Gammaproteobacteria bacterium]MDE2252253.1 hypothetical protein [Gammaproteobacteria bacterium]